MAIFIDHLRVNTNKKLCPSDIICHLCSDSNIDELHNFASHILGFKNKQWFDDRKGRQHYDIDYKEALIALRNGAKQKLFYKKNGIIIFPEEAV